MKKIIAGIMTIFVLFIMSSVVFAEMVMFNTKTLKYHKPTCQWAIKCTQNCIKIEKKEAIKRGGKPCRVCGG